MGPAAAAADREDAPGMYITNVSTRVAELAALGSAKVALLEAGAHVLVLELKSLPEPVNRLRARIEKPAGWISILNLASGFRWAQKHAKSFSPGLPPAPPRGISGLPNGGRVAIAVSDFLNGRLSADG